MSKTPEPTSVANALTLDGEADAIKDFYRRWAGTYDADLEPEYGAARFIAGIVDSVVHKQGPQLGLQRETARVLDAGCGTGLVGQALHELGYLVLDGVDISQEMVDEAKKRRIYEELTGDVDLSQPLPAAWDNRWDITVSCGVFTLGHVPPEALSTLIDVTRPKGIVAISTRTAYYEQSGYQAVAQRLIDDGTIAPVHQVRDGPYTADSSAHYWAYQVQ